MSNLVDLVMQVCVSVSVICFTLIVIGLTAIGFKQLWNEWNKTNEN